MGESGQCIKKDKILNVFSWLTKQTAKSSLPVVTFKFYVTDTNLISNKAKTLWKIPLGQVIQQRCLNIHVQSSARHFCLNKYETMPNPYWTKKIEGGIINFLGIVMNSRCVFSGCLFLLPYKQFVTFIGCFLGDQPLSITFF